MDDAHSLAFALLNRWQHGFPLEQAPFARIAGQLGVPADTVISTYRTLLADGRISRIGGVFGAGAGGAALLCAMAVPPHRLEAVAALVSAHPGVNHNYEREHRYNLWFVLTGASRARVDAQAGALHALAGCPMLRLPMQRAYRIDLGFDLHGRTAAHTEVRPAHAGAPVAPHERALAGLVEEGLALAARPFDVWAAGAGLSCAEVLATLGRWLDAGTLRRFGVVVRHHEIGFRANAMTVLDVDDDRVDACGAALARQDGITLAYRRARAPGWPYNLYCMVHGRDREAVGAALATALARSGLHGCPGAVLFSRRRFKQTGASYFRNTVPGDAHEAA